MQIRPAIKLASPVPAASVFKQVSGEMEIIKMQENLNYMLNSSCCVAGD